MKLSFLGNSQSRAMVLVGWVGDGNGRGHP